MNFDYEAYNFCNHLEKMYDKLRQSKNLYDLEVIYSEIKNNNDIFYRSDEIISTYRMIKNILKKSEQIFENEYIIDTTFKLNDISINDSSDESEILDYIVCEARKYLLNDQKFTVCYNTFYEIDFTNWCRCASNRIKKICKALNIDCYVVEIYPGFSMQDLLFDGCGYHFCNIIKLDNRYFLVDITYNQFFKTSDCQLGRIGVMDYSTPKLGAFVDINNIPKFIKDILYKGYTELDDKIFKAYFDLFAISYRNGLYYSQNEKKYIADYSVDDYINFLITCDSQVKHEGKEVLGYQKRPLIKCY